MGRRQTERRHQPHDFVEHIQRFAAGRQHTHIRTVFQHPLHEFGTGRQQMFTVVEDEQELLIVKVF